MQPVTRPRPASRILVVDSLDRVLLFDSRIAYGRFWLTPGGGLEPGESYEDAAVRELWEETGLQVESAGPCIWATRFWFDYEGAIYDQAERYFLQRVETLDLDASNWQESEKTEIQQHRWFSVAEIAASPDRFRPIRLAELLVPILKGYVPEEPLIVEA